MDHVRSAAVNFLVPAGCVYDPPEEIGLVSILSDMITRGAGDHDKRALTLAMDSLGLDHSESVGQLHLRFWGSTLDRNIPPALEIFADILRRPHFPEEELDAVKALSLQDLQALEDEPRGKVMVELRRRFWPMPLGQDRRGTEESIGRITAESIRAFHERQFGPKGTILSVAGNMEWAPLKEQVEKLFGDWAGNDIHPPPLIPPTNGNAHLDKDTTQTQIVIAYPSVTFGDPEYYAALGAVQVLSGGMGARLFTEVREKRGLCYAVSANYQTFKQAAGVLCYAGTTTERAQETLDVTITELKRLADGVTDEEVQRVRAGLKSSVIMQEESTSSRAGALASDWYYLGRVRSTAEIQQAIDALSPQSILEHVKKHPPENFTIVTLGKNALRLPGALEPAAKTTTRKKVVKAKKNVKAKAKTTKAKAAIAVAKRSKPKPAIKAKKAKTKPKAKAKAKATAKRITKTRKTKTRK
jgi:predicted Zn-dependent peptidase